MTDCRNIVPLLANVDWDLHPAPIWLAGKSCVETREQVALDGAQRLTIARKAYEGDRCDAIRGIAGLKIDRLVGAKRRPRSESWEGD